MRDVYHAIADPTRRQLMRMLAQAGELPLHEMTRHFRMGRTAISKHLAVLRDAGLVRDRKAGRETLYRLNAEPLQEVQAWLSFYERFWQPRIQALQQWLEEEPLLKKLELDFHFQSPIEKVWFALTDSATLSKWMMFKENNFKPVVGHRFYLKMEAVGEWSGVVEGEVLEVDEPHRLSYTWESLGEKNTVTWTLTEEADGSTSVHFEQANISSDQALTGAKYGWQSMAKQLEGVLAEL